MKKFKVRNVFVFVVGCLLLSQNFSVSALPPKFNKSASVFGQLFDEIEPELNIAARCGDIERMRDLLNAGADINVHNPAGGWTPLHEASFANNVDAVKFLLDNGANVDEVDMKKRTCLSMAVSMGKIDLVRLLVENGADVDYKNTTKWTPLHLAAKNGATDIAEYLLSRNADVDVANFHGQTPLQVAVFYQKPDVIKTLLRYHANPGFVDKHGKTPRDYVNGNLEILNLLK